MIPRYTRPEMGRLWTDEFRWNTILEVELLAAESYARTPADRRAVRVLRRRARVDTDRIAEIEKTTKHDVIAFLTQIEERVGSAARVLHRGLTSSDVLDTALAVQMARSVDLWLAGWARLTAAVRRLALAHARTPMMGRSHGVHGEPITFGIKAAGWHAELLRNRRRLETVRREVAFGKLSGAMGTFAHLAPSVEAAVCRRLGLRPEPVSTQVVPRDRHASFLWGAAVAGAGLERIALEIRHLQRTEVLEAEEPFTPGQKGSSAMPHKRNPVVSENICGLARLLRAHAGAALENIALWHERDIAHSSVERVILPDTAAVFDTMIHRLAGVLEGLRVYPERMRANMARTAEIVCSQRVVVALAESGLAKQSAYEIVQQHALAAWTEGSSFRRALEADPRVGSRIGRRGLAACFNEAAFFRHARRVIRRGLSSP